MVVIVSYIRTLLTESERASEREMCVIYYILLDTIPHILIHILPMSFVLIWLRCQSMAISADRQIKIHVHNTSIMALFRLRTVHEIVEACHERIFCFKNEKSSFSFFIVHMKIAPIFEMICRHQFSWLCWLYVERLSFRFLSSDNRNKRNRRESWLIHASIQTLHTFRCCVLLCRSIYWNISLEPKCSVCRKQLEEKELT